MTVTINGMNSHYKFPLKVREFMVEVVKNPKETNVAEDMKFGVIVLARCQDKDSDPDKWFFLFRGFFGGSYSAIELGVPPPANSRISKIRYLYGDTFGFELVSLKKGVSESWFYVTSCPVRGGKDIVGAFLKDRAEAMMKELKVPKQK